MVVAVLFVSIIAGVASSGAAWVAGWGWLAVMLAYPAGGLLAVMTMLAVLIAISRGREAGWFQVPARAVAAAVARTSPFLSAARPDSAQVLGRAAGRHDHGLEVRLAMLAAACLVAIGAALWAILRALFHQHGGVTIHSHELGQLLGFAGPLDETPIGIYRPHLTGLPELAQPVIARLLHVDLWVYAALSLPLIVVCASLAFARLLGRAEKRRSESYL